MKYYCNLCDAQTYEEFICDTCEEYYCEDCSYLFGIHYQFTGSRCHECANQCRLTALSPKIARSNTIKRIIGDIN